MEASRARVDTLPDSDSTSLVVHQADMQSAALTATAGGRCIQLTAVSEAPVLRNMEALAATGLVSTPDDVEV